MAITAMTALQTTTLTANATSVTFSSIPNIYKDLMVVVSGRVGDYDWIAMQFNDDASNNYGYTFMYGDGSNKVATNNSSSSAWFGRMSPGANYKSISIGHIIDYSANDKMKVVLGRGNSPDDLTTVIASRWGSTNVINKIKVITHGSENLLAGMTLSLYGIVGEI